MEEEQQIYRSPDEVKIEQDIYAAVAADIRTQPHNTVRASEIGHPCDRFLVYSITNPDDRAPTSPDLQHLYDLGTFLEELAKVRFRKAGYKINEIKRGEYWSKHNISGHIDFEVENPDGIIAPVEAKSMERFSWDKLALDVDKWKMDHRVWVRKYPAQLLIYCILYGYDFGYFAVMSKHHSIIKIRRLNAVEEHWLEYGEQLIKRADYITDCVKKGAVPEKITNPSVCEKCDFFTLCLPDIDKGEPLQFLEQDAEFLEQLERREELKKSKSEFAQVDKLVKQRIGKDPIKAQIGNFLLLTKTRQKAIMEKTGTEEQKYLTIKKLKTEKPIDE